MSVRAPVACGPLLAHLRELLRLSTTIGGRAYEDQGKVFAVLSDYDQAIGFNPTYNQALNNCAGLQMSRGNTVGVIADWTVITQAITQPELQARLELHDAWRASVLRGGALLGKELALLDTIVEDISFSNRSFADVKFVRCCLSRSRFENCDFTGALFIESVFRECVFVDCEFHKADFRDADCAEADFSNSRLTRSDLSGAVFNGANLANCDLSWAWLIRTDLRGANLEGIRWEGARLSGTKVYNRRRFRFGAMSRMSVKNIDVSEAGDASEIRQEDGFQMLVQM
ncbi:MAG: pentapeptide repeat-containing protein [Anaerolineae bacterium]|nr:pentapeptide repeat-containing protein [Anaerolineae bacterium]